MMDSNTLNMEERLVTTSADGSEQDVGEHTQVTLSEGTKADNAEDKKKFAEILAEVKENCGIFYQLRGLKDKDLFPLLNILKKVGIKDLKNAFLQDASGKKSIRDIGIMTALDLTDILLGNLKNVEDEVYALWSDISGMPVDDIKEMEFGTLPLMIADTFVQAGNSSFFRVLSRFLS